MSQGQAYGYEVEYVDASSERFARVERPQLALGAQGEPQMLFNGVCRGFPSVEKVYECLELKSVGGLPARPVMTWTLARPVGG